MCVKEACLIQVSCESLNALQADLLAESNEMDYFALESVLKGNFIIKHKWRKGVE
mgnify:CR=1 FL=1